MTDAEKRREFGEIVHAVERAAAQLARPWKIACGLLAVALAVALTGNCRKRHAKRGA